MSLSWFDPTQPSITITINSTLFKQAEKPKSREMKEGWMKNDEGWMKVEGWRMMISSFQPAFNLHDKDKVKFVQSEEQRR